MNLGIMFEIAWQLDGIFSKLCVFYIFYSKYNNFVIFTQNQRRTSLGSSVYRQESIKKSIFGWLFEYGTFSITVLMALLTKKTFTRTWLSCESGSKMFHIRIISGIWNIVQRFHIFRRLFEYGTFPIIILMALLTKKHSPELYYPDEGV